MQHLLLRLLQMLQLVKAAADAAAAKGQLQMLL
jgi:hypothetical protein